MAQSQQQISLQMLAQLRRLDPSVSAEVGTPERKIIDTVAQALADAQVDLTGLQQSLDIDGKFGDGLDRFLALFGFARQKATYSTGFLTFGRDVASTVNIVIPSNTQVRVPVTDANGAYQQSSFYTTLSVTLNAGQTEVVAPIRAAVAGTASNVAANTIVEMVGTPVLGITNVTNETATRGGVDREGDAELKIRFKNTVFRNLAGTRDQYLALAVSTQFSLKANVVGPQSYWREYMQVPPVDDATAYDVGGSFATEAGNGIVGEYSTALTTLPYAKGIWTNLPSFASNGSQGTSTIFYRPDVDFRMNVALNARSIGDAFRFLAIGGINPVNYPNRPNYTFTNVYTGPNEDIQSIRPGDLILCEFAYMSDASRNDLTRNITNAVDVYVDGGNNQFSTNVLGAPTNATVFVNNPTSKYHFENYRRTGQPTRRPVKGNYFMALMWGPVMDLPTQIIVGDNTYLKDTHYWLVEDVSELKGSVRARNGIEWSQTVKGNTSGTPRLITEWVGINFEPIEVEGYSFDRNIVDLQSNLEASKQVTTDVLAHKATKRYFKFDLTVMYQQGALKNEVNQDIHDAIDTYLKGQYFGTVIQLSDVLQVVHGVDGVDNVRWSSDYPGNEDVSRVWETDQSGMPLLGITTEHVTIGTVSTPASQALYINGNPQKDASTFVLTWNGLDSASIDYDSLFAPSDIETALNAIAGIGTVTVAKEDRSTAKDGQESYIITWSTNGARSLITARANFTSTAERTLFSTDFILSDSELPALPIAAFSGATYHGNEQQLPVDTLPGLIIRTRAQSTFVRAN